MLSFDHTPLVYWALGYALAGLVVWVGVTRRFSNWLYLGLGGVLLVMMRLPSVVMNRELNPDESQMISHALTLYHHPVYWQSVDGTTIGPLNNYLLVLPRLLGFPIDYTAARVMALLCVLGALLFFFGALRRWFGSRTARLALLFPLLFLAFTQEPDFVHYSSEQLPVLLLSLCLWLLARLSTAPAGCHLRRLTGLAYGLGLVAGMVPFAKLQAVPQALVLAVGGTWVLFRYFQTSGTLRPLLWLLLGGLSFPALTLAWTLYHQVFDDLINFYLLGNAIYASSNGLAEVPAALVRLVGLSPDFMVYALVLLVPLGLAVGTWLRPRRPGRAGGVTLCVIFTAYLLASVYAATKSGNAFVHYLMLCLYPLVLAAAAGLHNIRKWKAAVVWVGPVVWLLWFAGMDARSLVRDRQLNAFYSEGATSLPQSTLVAHLKKYAQPDDYLVVWGWQNSYYVEAQLPQGTAENHSERCIFEHPMRDTYRARYISDMRRNQPAVFVDAIDNSLWLGNRATEGIHTFPELHNYVQQHYRYAGTFDKSLLYIRNDRYQAATEGDAPAPSTNP
jgi:hypothetical protein